jgi:hypothetical protein
MLDPIIAFFTRIFQAIGQGIGLFVGILLWPFLAAGRWYLRHGWLIKAPIAIVVILIAGLYVYFIWETQRWHNFNTAYPDAYDFNARELSAGEQAVEPAAASCGRSAIADVAADLTDFNVNQNAWISSMVLYQLGFFGLDWDRTPFFDNKASFQRGVNQAVRRTAVELVDTLGRVRGTSQVDTNLQAARGNLQFDEETWYFGISPFGPKTPTPSFYRAAIRDLRQFNTRLESCNATFDARADNLVQFMDRIANDIGSTSAILRDRSENYNGGWFDTRADDRFWFAYGQLYGYFGILRAARADFEDVIRSRQLAPLWTTMEDQIRSAMKIQPLIISNGHEAGSIMPTHLATMGFYVLRVRSNLVELRAVLDR